MEFKINVEDVKQFLLQNGYLWNGKVLTSIGTEEKATIGHFMSFNPVSVRLVTLNGEYYIDMRVQPTTFKFMAEDRNGDNYEVVKDLSKQWMKYLLQHRTEDYAPYIIDLCKTKKRDAEKENIRANIELEETRKKINRKFNNLVAEYDKLEKIAQLVLQNKTEINF